MTAAPLLRVSVRKRQARFRKPDKKGMLGTGEFFLLIDISAASSPVFIPLSIASGKKPAGFVYQIEGTAEGEIATTDISVQGEGITQVTSGTLLYAKIPAGRTATFRLLITMRGKAGKEYGVTITRINYKHAPSDARYQKYETPLKSAQTRFR